MPDGCLYFYLLLYEIQNLGENKRFRLIYKEKEFIYRPGPCGLDILDWLFLLPVILHHYDQELYYFYDCPCHCAMLPDMFALSSIDAFPLREAFASHVLASILGTRWVSVYIVK